MSCCAGVNEGRAGAPDANPNKGHRVAVRVALAKPATRFFQLRLVFMWFFSCRRRIGRLRGSPAALLVAWIALPSGNVRPHHEAGDLRGLLTRKVRKVFWLRQPTRGRARSTATGRQIRATGSLGDPVDPSPRLGACRPARCGAARDPTLPRPGRTGSSWPTGPGRR